MTDLLNVLPSFPTELYTHLIPSLEKSYITTSDLLTLDAIEVAKRAQLPPLDVKRLIAHILAHLHAELGIGKEQHVEGSAKRFDDVPAPSEPAYGKLARDRGTLLESDWNTICLGDEKLDRSLGGGVPTGYITEFVGESGAGKTQLLLTLLLTVQMPAPHGLNKAALYISTEHPLPTSRLTQLIRLHPLLADLPDPSRPSLARILSRTTSDLEEQDHIIHYQLPIALSRHNVGLVVIDSIAAHYRAEKSSSTSAAKGESGRSKALAERGTQLSQLCAYLRKLAREHNCAIVVANQVSDRFSPLPTSSANASRSPPLTQRAPGTWSSSPAAPSQQYQALNAVVAAPDVQPPPLVLSLDHQLRWITGWGDSPPGMRWEAISTNEKTPALGLTWSNQIDCRIALIKDERITRSDNQETQAPSSMVVPMTTTGQRAAEWAPRRWRRHMRLVFAPWEAASREGDKGVEFEIWQGGVRSTAS